MRNLAIFLIMCCLLFGPVRDEEATAKDFVIESNPGICQNCPVEYSLSEIQFVEYNKAWAKGSWIPSEGQGSGSSTILHTTDGGRTWTPKLDFIRQHVAEEELPFFFIDSKRGWISWFGDDDAQDHLIRTLDGGATWQPLSAPLLGKISHLRFFDEKLGYAVEASLDSHSFFAITRDGGLSWSRNNLPLKYIRHMFFLTPEVGWLIGKSDELNLCVLTTISGGLKWDKWELGGHQRGNPRDFFAVNSQNAWLVLWHADHGSTMLRTRDGGATWIQHPNGSFRGTNNYLSVIRFISEKIGFAFYEDTKQNKAHVLYTMDGGESWESFPITQVVESCQIFQGELLCGAGLYLLRVRAFTENQ